MKMLRRNCVKFTYEKNLGMSDYDPIAGEYTGEHTVRYDEPVTYYGNISTATGYAQITMFGVNPDYTHVILLDDPKADIQETGLIRYNGEAYEVMAVRPSLNVLALAVKRMTRDVRFDT